MLFLFSGPLAFPAPPTSNGVSETVISTGDRRPFAIMGRISLPSGSNTASPSGGALSFFSIMLSYVYPLCHGNARARLPL